MSATPEAVQGGMGGAPGMPPPGAGGGEAPPGAAPMMTPQQPKGQQTGGDVAVAVAVKLLTQALQAHAPMTLKGQVIMKAISALTKEFGQDEEKAQELMPAELKAALSGPGGATGGPQPGGRP